MLLTWPMTNGTGAGAAFQLPLKNSLVPVSSTGSGTPTFTRATVAYQTDFENKYNVVLSGEARFQGARRVRNLVVENMAGAGWVDSHSGTGLASTVTAGSVDPLGGTTAFRITASLNGGTAAGDISCLAASFTPPASGTGSRSIWLKNNGGTTSILLKVAAGGGTDLVTIDNTWRRYSPIPVANAAGSNQLVVGARGTVNNGAVIDLLAWHPQYEDITGQANQNPSEYVSVGVLSAPFQGAGVDGVQYFTTLNGNTVASNVVTEATGAVIKTGAAGVVAQAPVDAGGPFGYYAESAATEIITTADIRDMTTANWTLGATMTRARTSVGADGAANSATRLTGGAVAGTNTITFLVTAAASSRTYSCLMKRVTGAGTVLLTQLAATLDITAQLVAGQWVRVQFNSSQLNATIGVQINTNGDAVDVDFNSFEAGAFATSRMASAGAARNADVLTYPFAGNALGTAGTCYGELSTEWATAAPSSIAVSPDTVSAFLYVANAVPATQIQNFDGTGNVTKGALSDMSTAVRKRAASWGAGGRSITGDGAAVASGAFDGDMGSTAIGVGCFTNGANSWNGTIRNIRIWTQQLTSAQLIGLTS